MGRLSLRKAWEMRRTFGSTLDSTFTLWTNARVVHILWVKLCACFSFYFQEIWALLKEVLKGTLIDLFLAQSGARHKEVGMPFRRIVVSHFSLSMATAKTQRTQRASSFPEISLHSSASSRFKFDWLLKYENSG